jgi:hypothetical protein
MTDIIELATISPEQVEDLETVHAWLGEYAKAVVEVERLETDPAFAKVREAREQMIVLEGKIKTRMKETCYTKVENAGYEALMVVRHAAPSVEYDIKHIEQEAWGSACIVKAVDAEVFNAICKAKSIEVQEFCSITPGKESKAVTIRKIEDKKP